VTFKLSSFGGKSEPYYMLVAVSAVDTSKTTIIRDFSTDPIVTWKNPPAGRYYIVAHVADLAGNYDTAYIGYLVEPNGAPVPLAAPTVAASPAGIVQPGTTVRFTASGVEGTGTAPYKYYYELYQNWDLKTAAPFYGGGLVDTPYVDWAVPAGTTVKNWQVRVVVVDSVGNLAETFLNVQVDV
jgi:hypothetical protein